MWTFLQITLTNGQQKYERMSKVTTHQGNCKSGYSKISSHSCQDDYYQKTEDNKCSQGLGETGVLPHGWWECNMAAEVAEQQGVLCGMKRH